MGAGPRWLHAVMAGVQWELAQEWTSTSQPQGVSGEKRQEVQKGWLMATRCTGASL